MKTFYWIIFSLCGALLILMVYDIWNGFPLIDNPLVGKAVYSILKPKMLNVGTGIVLVVSSLILYDKRKLNVALLMLGICLALTCVRMIYYR